MLDDVVLKDDGEKSPLICTIFGDPGLGKTTLAATFPNPIFLRLEDGLKSVNPRPHTFPICYKSEAVFGYLQALRKEDHNYKTLVIDSVSQLDEVFSAEILAEDPNAKALNLAHGGYGAAYNMLAAKHGKVRKYAEILMREKSMNIVFVGHTELEDINPPDGSGQYNKYNIRLSKKSRCHYIDNVDLVGFLKLDYFIKGEKTEKRKKALDNGERILVCHATASNVSKNRLGIDEPLAVERNKNPLQEYI